MNNDLIFVSAIALVLLAYQWFLVRKTAMEVFPPFGLLCVRDYARIHRLRFKVLSGLLAAGFVVYELAVSHFDAMHGMFM
ncbi:hypothetical protein [Pseudobacteriovorax antillogorgiicola]|uniref:Uncharacterized protein n=1 Tax=Pseudobacteriovorax antillogorgiicola TaxID=1513793 RepID=A0A1Y6CHE1_9BACT|nr:hypothetical protein [Pseudobacteriovorax antillogorgiicola]TCS47286.1 hypothetical protein EDD56_12161 [Pseudobacteriovorax antillogorgiicola]SMF62338.1 hypothetical protein SAMN06296036_12161 [Pseudobacteriovorax antillogorgiicola]